MIRTLWFLFHLMVGTVCFGTLAIVCGLLGVPNKPNGVYDWAARSWSRQMLWASGVTVRIVGESNIPANTPVVYVSNHQSWFDIFLLAGRLAGQVRFVAKKELTKVPIFGRALRTTGHISIDRQDRKAAFSAYEEAAQAIRGGMSAVVFAEGTRSRTGELLPFKKGPFVLAIAAQVPVVPVYCAGTFDLLPKGKLRLRPHPIALLFGEPISTEGMVYDDREGLSSEARRRVVQLRVDSASVLG